MRLSLEVLRRPARWLHRHAPTIAWVAMAGIVVWGFLAIQAFLDDQERVRCQDAIEGRADLRQAIPGVVNEMFLPDAEGDDLDRLNVYVQRGRAYLEREYGDPPCAARLGVHVPEANPPTKE